MCTNSKTIFTRTPRKGGDSDTVILWSQSYDLFKDMGETNIMNFVNHSGIKSLYNFFDFEHYRYSDPKPIPCGICDECIKKRQDDWCIRLQEELKHSKTAYFITWTYDNEHCPEEVSKYDIQCHIKRLRENAIKYEIQYKGIDYKIGLRYFIVSEYGPTTGRPHYHGILFNLNIPDLKYITQNAQGDCIYGSKWLETKWGKGFITIGNVTDRSIRYVTKYLLKDRKGFTLMSKVPILGYKEFENIMNDEMYLKCGEHIVKKSIPRAYLKKLDDDTLEKLHKQRELTSEGMNVENSHHEDSKLRAARLKEKVRINKMRNQVI